MNLLNGNGCQYYLLNGLIIINNINWPISNMPKLRPIMLLDRELILPGNSNVTLKYVIINVNAQITYNAVQIYLIKTYTI